MTEDCDDADPHRHPGAIEVCNGEDDDCDGVADEGALHTWFLDQDADGFGDPSQVAEACDLPAGHVSNADDCGVDAPAVNPDAPELCGGVDEDCDGAVDEAGAQGERVAFEDRDGDGYGSADHVVVACEPAEGTVDNALDCDDERADTWPGAEEVWYDGVDQDCMGGDDYDADGDGFQTELRGDDCDDTNALVHPGAEEVCGNGLDDDCSAEPGECEVWGSHTARTEADLIIEGDDRGAQWMGEDVVFGGDWNQDGLEDLVISEPANGNNSEGRVHLFGPPLSSPSTDADAFATLVGVDAGGYLGFHLALAGDLDGDGVSELLLGAYDPQGTQTDQVVWITSGPVAGTHDIDEVAVPIRLFNNGTSALSLSGGVDVDGDAQPDILIGVGGEDSLRGGAWLLTSRPSQRADLTQLDSVHFLGEASGDVAGWDVLLADDLDGDGLGELVIAARDASRAGADAGAVYLVRSPFSAEVALEDADIIYAGEAVADQLGWAIAQAGDTDGDGRGELLLGARGSDQADQDAGAVYIVDPSVEASLSSVTRRLLGSSYYDRAGEEVAGAGDIDADGYADVAIGAPDAPAATGPGRAWLVYGPVTGTLDLNSRAGAVFQGVDVLDTLPGSLAGPGDFDGDGFDDLVFSAPYADNSQGEPGQGQVYLFFGGSI
ncbi:MAG: FG-GAP repeat protein [Alphaproteobacteria bacterium]|nr:FG-GAP repeat protein [Alphaproteobacteria bacterium]